jgi:PKHD-type hydroxylase
VSAIVLTGVVPAEILTQIRARVAAGRFVPGRETAVGGAVAVKHNLQLARDEPAEARAVELLVGVLQAHSLFQVATWADGMMRPMFCRYTAGMSYGDHIDGAIMGEPPHMLRCDIAVTVSLSDATEYEGGELVIDTAGLPQPWKGNAGDVIVYAADTMHRVSEVTRGIRDVAVLWIQSLVRDPGRRRVLYDLRSAIDAMEQTPSAAAHVEAIRRSYFNLIRMWV